MALSETEKSYYKAIYKSKVGREVRQYGYDSDRYKTRLVTKHSILFLFGEGHEGLGLKSKNEE